MRTAGTNELLCYTIINYINSCILLLRHYVKLWIFYHWELVRKCDQIQKRYNNNKIETQIGNVGQYRNDKKGHDA